MIQVLALMSTPCLIDCKMVCHKKCICKIVTSCYTFCAKKVCLILENASLHSVFVECKGLG